MSIARHGGMAGLACLLGCGGALPARASSMPAIEPRILAQEGLAIGLASNVLQSQLLVVLDSSGTSHKCQAQDGGGSAQLVSRQVVSSSVTKVTVDIFYDTACTQPYIDADVTVTTQSDGSVDATGSAAYVTPKGKKIGSLTVSESVTGTRHQLVLIGTGTFQPADGAPSVSLGLECTIPSRGRSFPCQGGIAQTFPALNLSLASVTPLTLVEKKSGAVSFSGTSSDMQTGSAGSLSIVEATPDSLGIAGGGTAYASPATKGEAGSFTLFPPQPTHWTITDSANDAAFSIDVVSNTTRDLRGSVKTVSTGASLASINVDQSGTGSIAYADGSKSKIEGWLLGD